MHLQKVMNSIIDEAQSAFLPGRLITDNAIIAFEVFYNINISLLKRDPYMALKLGMSKAFDCVEWGFPEILFQKMGFPNQFQCLVMSCITTAAY